MIRSRSPAARPAAATYHQIKTLARLKLLAGLASVVACLALLGLFLTYQRFSPSRPLVLVGDQTITKQDYLDALEQRDGRDVFNDLVEAALVRQAAAAKGLLPTGAEVDARLSLLRERDPGLVQSATAAGTLPQLRDRLVSQLALENLRIQGVTASDAEIARYYATHQALFATEAQARMTLVVADTREARSAAREGLRGNVAPAVLARRPGLHLVGQGGYRVDLSTPEGRALVQSWKTMRAGEVRSSPFGGKSLVARLDSAQTAEARPLSDVQADVSRLVRLDKAVSAEAEVARLYRDNPPTFAVPKYAAYFNGVGGGGARP